MVVSQWFRIIERVYEHKETQGHEGPVEGECLVLGGVDILESPGLLR